MNQQTFAELYTLLNNITIPLVTNNRHGFPKHRRATFGLVRQRFTGVTTHSVFTKKYPKIYEQLIYIANLCKFKFNSVHINKNVVCPPHKDSKNIGSSMIVSFGDYTGCKLVIDGVEHDAKYNPIIFNGYEQEHYNTDDLVGTKYSVIYYNIRNPLHLPLYVGINYRIAIPSYNRSAEISKKTLRMLADGGVPCGLIDIFVANEEEYSKYMSAIPPELYYNMIIGELGIVQQRRFIANYYEDGQRIISIDDDVQGIFIKQNDKLERVSDVMAFFKYAFNTLEDTGLYIWGVYPVFNPFFMKSDDVTTNLKFILGTMYGFINRRTSDLIPDIKSAEKEDVEQSLLYFIKDGGVVRLTNYTIKTKKHAAGGLGKTEQRIENNRMAAEYIKQTYPNYVRIFRRKNGMWEIKMKGS